MICPLTIIHDWHYCLPHELKLALAGEIGDFHYELIIRASKDESTTSYNFSRYLQNTFYSSNEIVTRTLFTMQLLNFALSDKDDPAYWQEERENLDKIYKAESHALMLPYSKDELLKAMSHIEPLYAKACQQWHHLTATQLSMKAVRKYIEEKRNQSPPQNAGLSVMHVIHPSTISVEDVTTKPRALDRYIRIHQIIKESQQNGIK